MAWSGCETLSKKRLAKATTGHQQLNNNALAGLRRVEKRMARWTLGRDPRGRARRWVKGDEDGVRDQTEMFSGSQPVEHGIIGMAYQIFTL